MKCAVSLVKHGAFYFLKVTFNYNFIKIFINVNRYISCYINLNII